MHGGVEAAARACAVHRPLLPPFSGEGGFMRHGGTLSRGYGCLGGASPHGRVGAGPPVGAAALGSGAAAASPRSGRAVPQASGPVLGATVHRREAAAHAVASGSAGDCRQAAAHSKTAVHAQDASPRSSAPTTAREAARSRAARDGDRGGAWSRPRQVCPAGTVIHSWHTHPRSPIWPRPAPVPAAWHRFAEARALLFEEWLSRASSHRAPSSGDALGVITT